MKNFFRKDLKLNKRWWHRLFVAIFSLLFVGLLFFFIADFVVDNPNIPKWEVSDVLEDRLTSEIIQIKDLAKPGEQIQESGRTHVLNTATRSDSIYADVYCSLEVEDKIEDIQRASGIDNLYIRNKFQKQNVPLETYRDYVVEKNINCLKPDAYSYTDRPRVTFLEPLDASTFYGNDVVFYKTSQIKSTLYMVMGIAITISALTGLFLLFVLLYYKVLLYIIFGNSGAKDDM